MGVSLPGPDGLARRGCEVPSADRDPSPRRSRGAAEARRRPVGRMGAPGSPSGSRAIRLRAEKAADRTSHGRTSLARFAGLPGISQRAAKFRRTVGSRRRPRADRLTGPAAWEPAAEPVMVADLLGGERPVVEGDLVQPADERAVEPRGRCPGGAVSRPRRNWQGHVGVRRGSIESGGEGSPSRNSSIRSPLDLARRRGASGRGRRGVRVDVVAPRPARRASGGGTGPRPACASSGGSARSAP